MHYTQRLCLFGLLIWNIPQTSCAFHHLDIFEEYRLVLLYNVPQLTFVRYFFMIRFRLRIFGADTAEVMVRLSQHIGSRDTRCPFVPLGVMLTLITCQGDVCCQVIIFPSVIKEHLMGRYLETINILLFLKCSPLVLSSVDESSLNPL